MSYRITCPYCFKEMNDDEVHFRSELVYQGECHIIPDNYDNLADFQQRYRGPDKEDILAKYRDWEFFEEKKDKIYEDFWKKFNGTTEYNPADEILQVKAYRRKVIDPTNKDHQRYLKAQTGGSYFIRDEQGMVTQIELNTGERCSRRVCKHCHNPLPDNYGKYHVKFAAVIGIVGSGKTVYLSQLLKRMKTYASKVGLSAIVNNTSVRTFLERNVVAAKEPLPGSTPATRLQQPLFYEMVKNAAGGRRVTETFVLYDVAGEVFKAPELVDRFAPFIEHADGAIVLIDPLQFDVVSGVAAKKDKLDEPSAVLDAIHDIVSHGRRDEKCHIPFAVCISKIDTEEVQHVLDPELRGLLLEDVRGISDARGFNLPIFNAKEYAPIGEGLTKFFLINESSLAQQMENNYSAYSYFAFTALGCDVQESIKDNGEKYQYPVGPVLPKRVEEPLLWLFHKLNYIEKNAPLPGEIICPECGSTDNYLLPENERKKEVKIGILKKRTVPVNRCCNECGNRWQYGDK